MTVKNEFFFRVAGAFSRRGIAFPRRPLTVEAARENEKGAPEK